MNSKLEFLSRRNQGRRLIGQYTHFLSEITGLSIDIFKSSFMSLEDSDQLYQHFISNIRAINSGVYVENSIKTILEEPERVRDEIQALSSSIVGSEKLYLITKLTEFCGAVEIDFDAVILHYDKIIAYDGDSFGLCSADSKTGVQIDTYTEGDGKELHGFIAFYPK